MKSSKNWRWPEGTLFRLRLREEEWIVTLDGPKDSENRISSESPLGQALHGWLANPGPTAEVPNKKNPKDPKIYEVLGLKLPGKDWVENRPELWEAIKLIGHEAVSVGPEKIASLYSEIRALGLLEEELHLESWSDLQRLAEWIRSGKIPNDFIEEVAPGLAYKRYLELLNQGDYRFASKIVTLLRDQLKQPWEAYNFVKGWKDRIPWENRDNLRVLLTAGIGTINHLWNEGYTSDPSLLKEALLWGEEALAIKEDGHTYCALQSVYRALNLDEQADKCLEKARALGKPCEITRFIRRVSEKELRLLEGAETDNPSF
jgi:tetratricopeptide (TPR) repeat protein